MAKADSSEIVILPMAMTSAVTRLTHIMCATGALEPTLLSRPNSAAV